MDFTEKDANDIVKSAAMAAFKKAQNAFTGEAMRLGIKTEQDVVDMIKDVRREIWEENHAQNNTRNN